MVGAASTPIKVERDERPIANQAGPIDETKRDAVARSGALIVHIIVDKHGRVVEIRSIAWILVPNQNQVAGLQPLITHRRVC